MTAPVDAGTAVEAFIGSAANTAAGPTDAGTGVEVLVGTGVDSIPAFANTGTAVEAFAGTGASNLSGFSDSGGSSQTATGFGSSLMSLPTDAGTGLFIAFNNAVGMGGSDLTPNFSDAGVGTFQVGPGPIPLKDAVDIAQATVFLLLSDRQINASLEKELQGLSIVLQVDENLQLLQEAVDYALYWARFLVADYQSDAGVIQDLLVLENVLTAAGAV
jgi:hypothetical protein